MSINKIFENINKLQKQINEASKINSATNKLLESTSYKNIITNPKLHQTLELNAKAVNKASDMVRSRSSIVDKLLDLPGYKDILSNPKLYQTLELNARAVNKASDMVRLRSSIVDKLLDLPGYKDILLNENTLNKISDTKKIRKKNKKNKFIKFNGEIENKIVVNINLPPYSEEVVDFFKEITMFLKSLRKNNIKFATTCFIILFYSFGASFRENLMDKITTEIMAKSKQEIKKMVKIYKETNQFNAFSNLGMITKDNVNLCESRKGGRIISLKYGQIVTYEKMKGKYILIKYKTNDITYEGVILKKYLKKL